MARSTIAFTNFTAGELSPRLDGRTDLGKYFNGCKTLENMVVHPHGAATRRPGTQFIHEVKTSSAQTRLIPFEFSTTHKWCYTSQPWCSYCFLPWLFQWRSCYHNICCWNDRVEWENI